MKIVLVDDDQDLRGALAQILERSGHEVRTAACGAEAIREVQNWHPEVVVCDMIMPQSEGFEVLRSVRKAAPSVAFIMMSGATGDLQDQLRVAPLLGADAVLRKPFDPTDLLSLIDTDQSAQQPAAFADCRA